MTTRTCADHSSARARRPPLQPSLEDGSSLRASSRLSLRPRPGILPLTWQRKGNGSSPSRYALVPSGSSGLPGSRKYSYEHGLCCRLSSDFYLCSFSDRYATSRLRLRLLLTSCALQILLHHAQNRPLLLLFFAFKAQPSPSLCLPRSSHPKQGSLRSTAPRHRHRSRL